MVGTIKRQCGVSPAGRVAEWFKAAVLKTAVGVSLPWVRIPPLPPILLSAYRRLEALFPAKLARSACALTLKWVAKIR